MTRSPYTPGPDADPIAYSIHIANTPTGRYDVMQPLPKPFHVNFDGLITRHLSMDGGRVVGFMEDPEPGSLDLTWRGFLSDPSAAVGLFLVTSDPSGHLASWGHPVSKVASVTDGAIAEAHQ